MYDVVIVGAGPAALTCLSALQEPYSLDELSASQFERACRGRTTTSSQRKNQHHVAVIDPQPQWLHQWRRNFHALDIEHLRSPAMAHPDMFDENALLAFAVAQGRSHELLESGCGDIKSLLSLGRPQDMWKLPSTRLFLDFCDHLVGRLKHDYFCEWVKTVRRENGPEGDDDGVSTDSDNNSLFQVVLGDGRIVSSKVVILATGIVGSAVIPSGLKKARHVLVPWQQLGSTKLRSTNRTDHGDSPSVLVVGGGLTAVQSAQKCIRRGQCQTLLCSRRPLVERHFDLPIEWFDKRCMGKCMSDFYHQPVQSRLELLKETRGGGSVPKVYMDQVRKMERLGQLKRVVGDVSYQGTNDCGRHSVLVNGKVQVFDKLILACGVKADGQAENSLYWNIAQDLSTTRGIVGGLPMVSEDLEWDDNLFVVGGMGGLNAGPDGANLMGMRRAAKVIVNRLGIHRWLLREKETSNVYTNPFSVFSESDESDDDD